MGRPRTIETDEEKCARIRQLIVIRAARTALGLSQREFGELVGLHYSSLARFETGKMRLKSTHIKNIMDLLDRSGLEIDILNKNGIHIHIPVHSISAMQDIDGIRASSEFYEHIDVIGI